MGHPLQSSPYDDESLIGFIFRLAERRRIRASSIFTEAGVSGLSNRPRLDLLENLSLVTGTPVMDLQNIAYGPPDPKWGTFRGRKLPSVLFDGWARFRRVCPACLSVSAHHRAFWDLAPVSACPVHRIKLVHACEACGRRLDWSAKSGVRSCGCGADLTSALRVPIDGAAASATGAVHGLLGDPQFSEEADRVRTLPPFSDLDDGTGVDFLWRLALVSEGTPRSGVFSPDKPGDVIHDAHRALALALECVDPWPEAFVAALDRMAVRWGDDAPRAAVRRWLDRLPAGQGMTIAAVIGTQAENPPVS